MATMAQASPPIEATASASFWDYWNPNWVSASANVALLIVAIVALVITYRALKASSEQSKIARVANEVAAFQYAMGEIGKDPVRDNRNLLMNGTRYDALIETVKTDASKIDPVSDEYKELWKILTAHDRFAAVANRSNEIETLLKEFQRDEIIQIFDKAEPFIKYIASSLKRPNWCIDLKKLREKY